MPRIVINGEEVRSPVTRFVLLVFVSVIAAVVLASAAAWVLILLGVGTVIVVVVAVLALLAAAIALPWLVISRAVGRDVGRRW